jgi:hypothetical protein
MKAIRQIGSLAFVLGLFTCIFAGVPWHVITSDDPVVPWWLKIAVFSLLGGFLVVMVTVALQTKKITKATTEVTDEPQSQTGVLLLNSTEVPGRQTSEILGLVQGHTVFAIWIVIDLCAILSFFV